MPAFSEDSRTAIRLTHSITYPQVEAFEYYTTSSSSCKEVNNDDLLALNRKQTGKGVFLPDAWIRRAGDRKLVRKGQRTPFDLRGRTIYGTFDSNCPQRERISDETKKHKIELIDEAFFESRRKRARFTTPPNTSNDSTPLSTPALSQSGSTDDSSDEECSDGCTSGRCHSCRMEELFEMYIDPSNCT